MKMRIVGMDAKKVFVQIMKNNEWEQKHINKNEFENLMRNEFPKYVAEYKEDNTNCNMADFFYHYGETDAMLRKGEAYIFQS